MAYTSFKCPACAAPVTLDETLASALRTTTRPVWCPNGHQLLHGALAPATAQTPRRCESTITVQTRSLVTGHVSPLTARCIERASWELLAACPHKAGGADPSLLCEQHAKTFTEQPDTAKCAHGQPLRVVALVPIGGDWRA